jgi:hypothetical protein
MFDTHNGSETTVTLTEQRTLQPIRSAGRQSNSDETSKTQRVRPSVAYFLGRPAQVWIDALGRRAIAAES